MSVHNYRIIGKDGEDVITGVGMVIIDPCGHLILRALPTDGSSAGPVLVAYAPGVWRKVEQA